MRPKPPPGLIQRKEGLLRAGRRKWLVLLSFVQNAPFLQFLLCVLIIASFELLLAAGHLDRLENNLQDFFFRQRPLSAHSDIVLIEIAEDSIKALGRWPWPRRYHAVLTHALNEWGAKAIVFDILFSEPGDPLDDQALEEAFAEHKIVYLPVVLEPVKDQSVWIHSLAQLESKAKGLGHINIAPDRDGTLRRIRPYLGHGTETYPHLALRVAYDFLEEDSRQRRIDKDFPLPLDEKGALLINWAGRWMKTFKHYSYIDVLRSFQAIQSGKKPIISPDKIKGKICIIGLTATGHADIKATPIEAAYPALGVHANVINSLLTHRLLIPTAARHVNAWLLVVVGILSLPVLIPFRNVFSFIGTVLLSLGWLALCYFLFDSQGILLYVMHPILLVIALFLFSGIIGLALVNKEKFYFFELATRDGLTGLYNIRHFRTLLARGIAMAQKSGESLSLILVDIDDFKKVNDTYGHQAGDMVLKATSQLIVLATRFKRSKEEADVVARYGGEEIIVMLRKSNLTDTAFTVAERIRKSVATNKFQWQNTVISVTLSLGVSTRYPDERTSDSLIRRADEALYRAKQQGKNQVCIENKVFGSPPSKQNEKSND